MSIIEKKKEINNYKKEREKNKKTTASINQSHSIGFKYEHELLFS